MTLRAACDAAYLCADSDCDGADCALRAIAEWLMTLGKLQLAPKFKRKGEKNG